MLLIDEVDRADDEFEALLLEFLGEGSVTVPELGTFTATRPPVVVLTSNRSRDLHDALRRRCLYHWLEFPSAERAVEILRRTVPGAGAAADRRRPPSSSGTCAPSTWTSRRAWPRRSTGSRRSRRSGRPSWSASDVVDHAGALAKTPDDRDLVAGAAESYAFG